MDNHGDLIVFDAACVFCSGFARLIHRHDRKAQFRFVTAQSGLGRALYQQNGLDPDAMTTNIVITGGVAHVKMLAFVAAMRALGGVWRVFIPLGWLPKRPSDWVYDRIAANRYLIAGRRACPTPPPELKARLIE